MIELPSILAPLLLSQIKLMLLGSFLRTVFFFGAADDVKYFHIADTLSYRTDRMSGVDYIPANAE